MLPRKESERSVPSLFNRRQRLCVYLGEQAFIFHYMTSTNNANKFTVYNIIAMVTCK
jgi:hypothetical protein